MKNMNAFLNKYHTMEFNEYICVWNHSKGEEPYWQTTDDEKFDLDNLEPRGRSMLTFNGHMQV
jgi:hypothetical protein